MNRTKTLIFSIFTCLTLTSFSQDYVSIYDASTEEVRDKMDYNKINNNPILMGVNSIISMEIETVSNDSLLELKTQLSNDIRISSFEINELTLNVIATGDYTLEDLKEHVKSISGVISKYTIGYGLSN